MGQLGPEGRRERLRRWRRSQGQYTGLRFWLLSRGTALGAVIALVYVAAGMVIGWQTAYDIAAGVSSPSIVTSPVPAAPEPSLAAVALAWFVSVAGWLAVPGFVGAVAGYAVAAHTDQRRAQPLDAFLPPEQLPTEGPDGA